MKNKIKIWWTHRVFNFKYPVKRTPTETWLKEYSKYLKKLKKLRGY